jgi:mRNA interferase RelE/StbE
VAEYGIEIKPSARKELEKLSDRLIGRVIARMEALAREPRPSGCKKLRGYKDVWRIRVGDYRVVYLIDDDQKIISITRIAHRSEAY